MGNQQRLISPETKENDLLQTFVMPPYHNNQAIGKTIRKSKALQKKREIWIKN